MKKNNIFPILVCVVIIVLNFVTYASVFDGKEEVKYYFENVIKTDNSYSEDKKKEIKTDDPHYNWRLGKFSVSGFTTKTEEEGVPVFLKTVGDKITLNFELEANIDDLKGDGIFSINEDNDGYDINFQTEKTNLKRGALFVRHINYQNVSGTVQSYTDYLVGKAVGANTEIQMLEEGDYEVALDYEIKKENKLLIVPLPAIKTNYRMYAKFKVRNGECMVYPFDIKTKAELHNNSITENGFYIDLAKSRYLDITIKRKIYIEDEETISDDTRFNRPARDGDEYTEEGIYTIVVKNKYTNETEEKSICVGNSKILKANFTQGITVKEYKERMANINKTNNDIVIDNDSVDVAEGNTINMTNILLVVCPLLIVLIIYILIKAKMKKKREDELKKAEDTNIPDPEETIEGND